MNSDNFCDICEDITSGSHDCFSISIITKYCIQNHPFFEIDNILDRYTEEYDKKFRFYFIICDYKLIFNNLTINISSARMSNVQKQSHRIFLLSKVDDFYNLKQINSHMSEIKCFCSET